MISKYAHLEYYKKRLEELGFKSCCQKMLKPRAFYMKKITKSNKQVSAVCNGDKKMFWLGIDSEEGLMELSKEYHVKDLKWRTAFSQMIKDMPDEVLRMD